MSLVVLNENQEFTENVDDKYKERIIEALLLDMILSLSTNSDINSSVKKLKSSISYLARKFYLDSNRLHNFILDKLQLQPNLNLRISFLLEEQKGEVIYNLEDETLKFLDVIYSFADFPFIIDPQNEA